MQWIKTTALLMLGLILGTNAATAQSSAAPRRIALLMGNWDYDMNQRFDAQSTPHFVPDLPFPCEDVNLIKTQLDRFRFEIHNFCNLDHKTLSRKVSDFRSAVEHLPKNSIVFVYYSGHGLQYNGRAFFVPVLFNVDIAALEGQTPLDRLNAIRSNANEVADLIDNLNDDKNVALVIALDNCRNDPFTPSEVYNNFVSIRTGPNALVQYATTPNETAPAGGGDSRYAALLGKELSHGGDLGKVMARVGIRIWQLYDAEKRGTYAETDVGPAFAAMRSIPLGPPRATPTPALANGTASATAATTGRSPPAPASAPDPTMPARTFRNVYDGISLDIFWCEGPGARQRYDIAAAIGRQVSDRAREFGVGRVRIKPLGEYINAHGGYNVERNLMRYDIKDLQGRDYTQEKSVLMKIALAFPDQSFLPRRGVGVGNKPTLNYVSAFICGDQN